VDLCLSIGSNGQIKCPLDISICPLDILQRYWTLIANLGMFALLIDNPLYPFDGGLSVRFVVVFYILFFISRQVPNTCLNVIQNVAPSCTSLISLHDKIFFRRSYAAAFSSCGVCGQLAFHNWIENRFKSLKYWKDSSLPKNMWIYTCRIFVRAIKIKRSPKFCHDELQSASTQRIVRVMRYAV
jgi:hypothetical protein